MQSPLPTPPHSFTQDLERMSSGIPILAAGASGSSGLTMDLERVSSSLNMVTISPIGSPEGELGAAPSGLPHFSLAVGSPPGATATLSLTVGGWVRLSGRVGWVRWVCV